MPHSALRICWRAISAASIMVLLATALPLSLFTPSPALGDSTWVVTSLADNGGSNTLRHAVDNSEDGDIIRFAPSLQGTITLDHELGQLVIDHPLTIEGPGSRYLAVSGGNETRVLFIKGPQPDCRLDGEEPTAEAGCCSGEGGGCSSGGACEAGDTTLPGRDAELAADPDVIVSGLT
ncbi:MAG: hypothetical protein KAQ74_03785, partial [Dehalococcoidia bacterium]|nr:hypothetical protein [Dehalococcoidia bacterium]